uniref:Uncharacterized mitochondrial protein AtMg00810-like n=1 Tax=Nicotiana tabacum TaxID=4097 RepID=A0A1S4C758_TOBAC|nr:PREDICTED: uncharacterized mitochondrial protein AtMg00810-like [Nicotiana tabacum]
MLIAENSLKLVEETKASLQQAFKMKDLGELKYFFGIEFARSKQGITMHQRKYAMELIPEVGLTAAKPALIPIDISMKLTSKQYNDHLGKNTKIEENALTDQTTYQRLIGKLLYLTVTRPDIAFGFHTLSQFLQRPKKSHMEAALRIVRYVKNQPGQGIFLSSNYSNNITTYCDANWAACTHKEICYWFLN